MHRRGALRAKLSTPDYDPVPGWAEPDTETPVFTFIKNAQTFINKVYGSFYEPDEELAGRASTTLTPINLYKGDPETGKPDDTSPFRRVPEGTLPPPHDQWEAQDWTGYSRGVIQPNDAAGPWLWADLFAALGKLTRIADGGSYTARVEYREDYDYSGELVPPPPYATLSGTVALPIKAGGYFSFFEVTMKRWEYGTTDAEMTIRLGIIEKEYYNADGVSASNKLVVLPSGDFPGAVFALTAADMGKTVVRDPLSTREEDGRHYFRAAFCDPASLIDVSRESIISAVVPWGGITTRYTYSDAQHMVTDYAFPDGDISASAG